MPTAAELARLLVEGVIAEKPDSATDRIAVILNGLGRTKYEELFVVWKTVAALLARAGLPWCNPRLASWSLASTWLAAR
jgi:dihydroxyacetone kinase